MPIAVTEEQTELASAVHGFATRSAPPEWTRSAFEALAAGGRPPWWDALVSQGLHAVHVPESDDGQGGTLTDLAVVVEEAGRALLPGPLLPTLVVSASTSAAPDGPARRALLAQLVAGGTAALVPVDAGVTAVPRGGGVVLRGDSGPVPGALSAEVLLVGALLDGVPGWYRVAPDAAGLARVAARGVDLTRDLGRVTFDEVAVAAEDVVEGLDAGRVADTLTALHAAELAGVMRWATETAVDHVRVREQFGKPVGSFQAVKHKAARLLVATELASAAAWDAARALTQGPEQRALAVGGAAVTCGGTAVDAVVEAVTLLGGIGFTWEHDLHLYWRRAIGSAGALGPRPRRQVDLGRVALDHTRDVDVDVESDPEFVAWVGSRLDEALALPADTPRGESTVHGAGPRRTMLADAGLVSPHWPKPWGLGATPSQQIVIAQEYARRGLTAPSTVIGEWAMPTILAHGTDEQRERFAHPTLRGDIVWCQLFSEPGAGSDLAGLSTRATKVEGGWQLSGQKVWTSQAHESDWGICLARTDPDVPKHKGLSYFLVDMTSPGLEVRPLRQSTGQAEFNEVFLDDVFVPDDLLLGEPGQGWRLTATTLSNERLSITSSSATTHDEPLCDLLRKDNVAVDRDEVLRTLGDVHAGGAAIAALGKHDTLRRLAGAQPGPGTSVGKVAAAELSRRAADAALALLGPEAALADAPGGVVEHELTVPMHLLGGGTVEIQLNVIAERVLGLPRG